MKSDISDYICDWCTAPMRELPGPVTGGDAWAGQTIFLCTKEGCGHERPEQVKSRCRICGCATCGGRVACNKDACVMAHINGQIAFAEATQFTVDVPTPKGWFL